MVARNSLTLLLLAVLGSQADASLRRRNNDNDKTVTRKLGQKNNLFQDDEGFWSRFVIGVQSSLPPVCAGDGGMLECPECCEDGSCVPCPGLVCPGEDGMVGAGMLDCGDGCCEDDGCVPCPGLVCPGEDGMVGDGMLDCGDGCCEDGGCVPCPAPVCPGEDGMVGDGILDCGDGCCEDDGCVPCPASVCPGEDGMVGDGMLDCGDDCCEDDACVPCPGLVCPGEDGTVGDGMLDCGDNCCEDDACVPCPAPVCPGEDGMVGDGMLDCGDDCCEDDACVPCPAPICPGEDGMAGDGMLDCGDDCCEDDGCVPCPGLVCPGEDGMVGDGMLDCGDDCCEDDGCVPCPGPVCPGEDGMVGEGMLDCGDDCCEDDACVPCPAPVCIEDGGDLDCGADCCESGACVPCPIPEECILEMNIDCPGCLAGNTTVENCAGRPLQMTMLYAGGDCNMSRNCQDDKFDCEDFNGGAPFEYGTESWIVATDTDEETIFYEGWVPVGSAYVMNNDFERFPADQIIKVYASENTEDESQLLQGVQYHSSCSQNLDLLNRFGSQVIVGWYNEEQGNITGFDNTTFAVSVDIPIDAVQFAGQDATVSGLTITKFSTTADGGFASPVEFFNLTSSVGGTQVGPGQTFDANLAIPINLAVETEYTFLITLSAETSAGVDCTATDLLQFTAGGSPLELGSTQACPSDEDDDDW